MRETKWAHEKWTCEQPPEDICCKDCMFREADRKMGEAVIAGHTLAICKVFTNLKPDDVLWHKAKCSYYISEKE